MPILKPIPTPNGITAAHRVMKTELTGTALRLQVHMYPSLDKAEDAHLLWQEYPELPLAALDVQDPVGSLERALAAQPDGLFAGATYVADAAVDDIETARARKWADIKAERDRLECGGFDMPGIGRFDSDADSRARIVGAVTAAKIAQDAGQPYTIAWTLADNSTADLDAAGIIAVGFALLAHIDAIHQRSRALREQIDAAQDSQVISAICWDAQPEPMQAELQPVETEQP